MVGLRTAWETPVPPGGFSFIHSLEYMVCFSHWAGSGCQVFIPPCGFGGRGSWKLGLLDTPLPSSTSSCSFPTQISPFDRAPPPVRDINLSSGLQRQDKPWRWLEHLDLVSKIWVVAWTVIREGTFIFQGILLNFSLPQPGPMEVSALALLAHHGVGLPVSQASVSRDGWDGFSVFQDGFL